MSNQYKIKLEAQKTPASFIAFDCLYFDGQDLTMHSLSERKKFLQKALKSESERLAISRTFDAAQALDLFRLVQDWELEGIVAKLKDSLYFQGKRTKAWLKMKNLQDDDFCGLRVYFEGKSYVQHCPWAV